MPRKDLSRRQLIDDELETSHSDQVDFDGYSAPPEVSDGYAEPPIPTPPPPASAPSRPAAPTPSTGPARAPSVDDRIGSMVAGGRISSRQMRQLELQARKEAADRSPAAVPPPPPAHSAPPPPARTWGPRPSESDLDPAVRAKRDRISSKIPKTPTTDNRGASLAFAAGDGPLQGKAKASKYEGEERMLGWRADVPGTREAYAAKHGLTEGSPEFEQAFDEYRRGGSMTTIHADDAERARSVLKRDEYDTVSLGHTKGARSYSQLAGWATDPESGLTHTFDPLMVEEKRAGGKQRNHHTTPLAGRPVAGAGLLTMSNDEISEITDESGHYQPEAEYTWQAVKAMGDQGLLRSSWEDEHDPNHKEWTSTKVTLKGLDPSDPRSGKQWLNDTQGIETGDLTLPYQAFLQTRGNERQARAKKTLMEQIRTSGSSPATSGSGSASALGEPERRMSQDIAEESTEVRASYEVPELSPRSDSDSDSESELEFDSDSDFEDSDSEFDSDELEDEQVGGSLLEDPKLVGAYFEVD